MVVSNRSAEVHSKSRRARPLLANCDGLPAACLLVCEGESGACKGGGEMIEWARFRAMEFAFSPCERTA